MANSETFKDLKLHEKETGKALLKLTVFRSCSREHFFFLHELMQHVRACYANSKYIFSHIVVC